MPFVWIYCFLNCRVYQRDLLSGLHKVQSLPESSGLSPILFRRALALAGTVQKFAEDEFKEDEQRRWIFKKRNYLLKSYWKSKFGIVFITIYWNTVYWNGILSIPERRDFQRCFVSSSARSNQMIWFLENVNCNGWHPPQIGLPRRATVNEFGKYAFY